MTLTMKQPLNEQLGFHVTSHKMRPLISSFFCLTIYCALVNADTGKDKVDIDLSNLVPKSLLYPGPDDQNDDDGGGLGRIVDGVEATPNEFPHLVALYITDINDDATYFCGGSIIAEDWILTAGHCCDGAKSIEVKAGAHDQSVSEEGQQAVQSVNIIRHADFQPSTLQNDVCVVQVSPVLELNDKVKPIGLTKINPEAGTVLTAAGWGKVKDNSTAVSDVVNKVSEPVLTKQECQSAYGPLVVTDQILCIDSKSGGTCFGDSGGPLMWDRGDGLFTAGITSFVSSSGCSSGKPDGFARIAFFYNWIVENTGISTE